MSGIRPAERGDIRAMAASLARAFHDDPVMQFFFPDEGSRTRRLSLFFRTAVRAQHLGNGSCYTDDDRTAAALWDPPGLWRMTLRQGIAALPTALASGFLRV